MNKKFTFKTILSGFATFALIGNLNAQDPASAVWSLLTDTSASVTGNVIASPQMTSPLLVPKQYGSAFDGGTNTGWQRKGVGQVFPSPFDATVYDEYKVKPVPGNNLKVTQLSFSALGGGTSNMRLAVYYSKDGFATFDSLSVGSASGGSGATYNNATYKATPTEPIILLNTSTTALAGREVVTFPGLNIDINAGDSLMIRTYPFLSSATTSTRYYPSKEVSISGTTTAATMPVTFSSTRAFQKSNGVQVEWTSATETNVSNYIIEKSTNGQSFKRIATVSATGNTTIGSTYSWFDATPSAGNNFYRVVAVDKDGSTKQTSIMRVSLAKGASELIISPNPVRGSVVNLQLGNLQKGSYTITVFSSNGQKMYTRQLSHEGGSASQTIQLPVLKQGVYNLQLSNSSVRLNKNMIVE